MSEIDAIHSVLSVAGSGFRLSLLLNAVGCEVASAGIDVHSIAKGLSLFVTVLKHVGRKLQTRDSPHSWDALNTAKEISMQGRAIFDDIEIMLDKAQQQDGTPVQERFIRSFKKQHVTYLLAHLESLKLSLMVMVQVLQLGKLAAAKRNTLEPAGNDIVQEERAETQNMVIIRYWAINRLDRLYDLAVRESMEHRHNEENPRVPNLQFNGTFTQASSTTVNRLPVISLGDLDSSLAPIRQSPKDMVRVSAKVIDPLIAHWTRLEGYAELPAEQRNAIRHTPNASCESESDHDYYSDVEGLDIGGHYLEGTTTDWRKPHSQEARKRAAELRKDYSGLQARVESDSDDGGEVQAESRPKNVRFASSDDNSASKDVAHRGRSNRRTNTENGNPKPSAPQVHIPTPEGNAYNIEHRDGRPASNSPRTIPRSIPQHPSPPLQRPQRYNYSSNPTPQTRPPSSQSIPAQQSPPTNYYSSSPRSSGFPSSYPPPTNPQYPPRNPHAHPTHPHLQPHPHPHSRHHHQPLETSRRSPSRQSSNSSGGGGGGGGGQSRRSQPRDDNNDRRKNLKRSAATGLLGAGAIAGFLEALEGLSM
ncbi:hypothetical protein FQN55_008932 [Onygenales sp. PD_40]|nr:hypothetical protein FQN55_008932 [Onygenales sp. PD_40]